MRLIIDNFAKIKHADIVIDGITVIAGENNTGKSTVGKVLYAAFNSMYDLDIRIENKRRNDIRDISNRIIRNLVRSDLREVRNSFYYSMLDKVSDELYTELIEMDTETLNKEAFQKAFLKRLNQYNLNINFDNREEYFDDAFEKFMARKKDNDHKVALELIGRYFLQSFAFHVGGLQNKDNPSNVSLIIKNSELLLKFKDNNCIDLQTNYNIMHEAFFIDDPFVLDELVQPPMFAPSNGIRGDLVRHLIRPEENIMDGVFEAVKAKENLKEIYDILNRVSSSDILLKNGEWMLKEKQFEEPIPFENLSAGLKSFVLIKMLLEKGILKEKDVLILDEPEIHLHPEWQLIYAEIIVLLQKKFDLSIIVTTHSRDFLEALELYAQKYELQSKCRYYRSGLENNLAIFEDVTDSMDKIYKQLVTPSILLDQLRYELVEDNE